MANQWASQIIDDSFALLAVHSRWRLALLVSEDVVLE
jgi:hypothetical protein